MAKVLPTGILEELQVTDITFRIDEGIQPVNIIARLDSRQLIAINLPACRDVSLHGADCP